MAQIVPSKNAPSEDFTVSFGVGLVKLTGKTKSFESTDAALLSEAANHPWLDVVYDKVEVLGGDVVPPSVDPKKDPLSAQNPANALVNDPDAVRAAQAAALGEDVAPVAIDPVLDQDKTKTEGGVDKTVAAAEKTTEKAGK